MQDDSELENFNSGSEVEILNNLLRFNGVVGDSAKRGLLRNL